MSERHPVRCPKCQTIVGTSCNKLLKFVVCADCHGHLTNLWMTAHDRTAHDPGDEDRA